MLTLSARTAHAMIPVADVARAKQWYEEKLGLRPAAENDFGAKYDLADGTGFILYPTAEAGKAPNTMFCFDSSNVPGDVAELKVQGVVFEEYDMPGIKTVDSVATVGDAQGAWFRDCDGNILAISSVLY